MTVVTSAVLFRSEINSSGFHSNGPLDYKLSGSEVLAKVSLTKRTSTFLDKPIRIIR